MSAAPKGPAGNGAMATGHYLQFVDVDHDRVAVAELTREELLRQGILQLALDLRRQAMQKQRLCIIDLARLTLVA